MLELSFELLLGIHFPLFDQLNNDFPLCQWIEMSHAAIGGRMDVGQSNSHVRITFRHGTDFFSEKFNLGQSFHLRKV